MPDHISSEALNQWLFNDDTINKVLMVLMERGIKVEGGDKLGKTIIFAKNHKHAERIVERFDILYPHYRGGFVRVIDNQVNYSQDLIDKFSDKHKMPQIAVSVDMLDTGIDIPEVVNLVFFKKVRSKAKFWQMIGRGTRLCVDLFGPGQHKDKFLIFDFCGNFEFFRVNQRGTEAKNIPSLTEKTFNTKVELIKGLQHLDYQEEHFVQYREQLVQGLIKEIKRLNRDSFVVKQHLRYFDKYADPAIWQAIGVIEMAELKDHIAPLIIPTEEDELAKRFDYLMFTIETALVLGKSFAAGQEKVIRTANALAQIGTIPQVLAQKDIIDLVRRQEFWMGADIIKFDKVRDALRDLVKFIERDIQPIYYTNFTDEILNIEEKFGDYVFNSLQNYRKKVNTYVRDHQNHISIHKLKTNKTLTKQDILSLEQILWQDVGTKDDYKREYGDTPVSLLVRQIVGLDQQAANEIFSEFLSDQDMDVRQIRFVKTIVDYVIKNGVMTDKRVLQEDPFQTIGSITDIFSTEKAMRIVSIIDQINKNATDVIGA
jgi:type I restriction enzyme R subunit